MPYVDQKIRAAIFDGIYIELNRITNAGELNYAITVMLKSYLETATYQEYNDAMGALEGAKLELYRRRLSPYEDQKKEENGDVY